MSASSIAEELVDELLENLGGRDGFDLSGVDPATLEAWKAEWVEIAFKHISAAAIETH